VLLLVLALVVVLAGGAVCLALVRSARRLTASTEQDREARLLAEAFEHQRNVTAPAAASDRPTGQDAAPALPTVPSGWFPDPAGTGGLRYWDGSAWTDQTA